MNNEDENRIASVYRLFELFSQIKYINYKTDSDPFDI